MYIQGKNVLTSASHPKVKTGGLLCDTEQINEKHAADIQGNIK